MYNPYGMSVQLLRTVHAPLKIHEAANSKGRANGRRRNSREPLRRRKPLEESVVSDLMGSCDYRRTTSRQQPVNAPILPIERE
jgi:hypothetical protein